MRKRNVMGKTFRIAVVFLMIGAILPLGGFVSQSQALAQESKTSGSTYEYESLDYFKITEGHGIKYHVTDDYYALDCNVWAVSQYFETNKPYELELDFVFTLIKEGTEGGYFRNSSVGGEVSQSSIDGKDLTLLYLGYPVGNQANFYRNFSLPRFFNSGDIWTSGDREYSVEYVGPQTVNGTEFDDCIKITIDDSLSDSGYLRGSGYFILARNIGIVELVFNRTNGKNVLYEYVEHEQLTRHTISGTINNSGVPVEGIIVQISNANWGIRSVTDSNGAFSIQVYGPDIVLRIGYDEDNDDVFEFDAPNFPREYCVNNITSDITGLSIDVQREAWYVNAHSAHFTPGLFASGYYVELAVKDPNQTIQSVNVRGPGIDGSISLVYGPSPYHPDWWWSRPNVDLGSDPPADLPLVYTFTITDKTGNVYTLQDSVQSYVHEFATNLSPSNNEMVSGELVFSWTGVSIPGVGYKIEIYDDSGNRIWDSPSTTSCFVTYDGPPLSPGNYQYYVCCFNEYGDSSLAYATFKIGTSPEPAITRAWTSDSSQGPEVTEFPAGTETVYVNYDYENPIGSVHKIIWYDGEGNVGGSAEHISEHESGTGTWRLTHSDIFRAGGDFSADLFINDILLASVSWTVEGVPEIKVTRWGITNLWEVSTLHQFLNEIASLSGYSIDCIVDVYLTNDDFIRSVGIKLSTGEFKYLVKEEPGYYSLHLRSYEFSPERYSNYLSTLLKIALTYFDYITFGIPSPEHTPEVAITEITIVDSEINIYHITRSESGQTLPERLPSYEGAISTMIRGPWGAQGGTLYSAHCPVDLLVEDLQGRRVGALYESGVFIGEINEIPDAFYGGQGLELQFIYIPGSFENYTVEVIGRNTGSYILDVLTFKEEESSSFIAIEIATTSQAVHQLTIDWDVLSEGGAGVTIQKDSDGDGEFEETVVTSQPNKPSNPSPLNGAADVSVETDLSWSGGDPDAEDIVTYDVYFDTTNATTLVCNDQLATTYNPRTLGKGTTCYWRIVARDNHGVIKEGPVWDFITEGRKGDFTGDGYIDFDDFVCFAAAYRSELEDDNYNPIGDFNDDGHIDFDDFVDFAQVYGT